MNSTIPPNTENFISIPRINNEPVIINRSYENNNSNDWLSQGYLNNNNNNNDISAFDNISPSTVLTIYDTIYRRSLSNDNPVSFYNPDILRPQVSHPIINHAINNLHNFFNNPNIIASTFASTSGGMTSHCILRLSDTFYLAYVSATSGPYSIEIVDRSFINYINPLI
tara:strand:+ start:107 stop:610 length:504 start_codon:yes stop_codon:yes gene_type:complete